MKYRGKIYVTKRIMESGLMFKDIEQMLKDLEQGRLDPFLAIKHSEMLLEILAMKNREK